MKDIRFMAAVMCIAMLTACSGGNKKNIMIMASGKVTVGSSDNKNITLEPGTRHTEEEIVLESGDKETLTVQSPDGNKTYDLSEGGHYLLNLKKDTLVGGLVNYGTGARTSNLTGEDVDNIIDSTQKLIAGQNVSDESKTYFIPPFTMKKISDNAASKIIGPYNGIPGSISADGAGKAPEIYKLFTAKQKREDLEKLIMERKK